MGSSEPTTARAAYMYDEDEEGNRVHGTRRSAKKKGEKTKPAPKVSHRGDEKKHSRSDSGVDTTAYGPVTVRADERLEYDAMVPREVTVERRRSVASKSKSYETSSPSKSRSATKGDEARYYGIPKSKPKPIQTFAQPLVHRPAALATQSNSARPGSYHAPYPGASSGPPISHQTFWQQQQQAAQPYPPPMGPPSAFIPSSPSPSDYMPAPSPSNSRSLSDRFGTPQRTGSGFGLRDPVVQQRRPDSYEVASYTPSQDGARSIRTPSKQKVIRSKAEIDSLAMPPPARPASARPGPPRPAVDYNYNDATAPEPQFRDPFIPHDVEAMYREEQSMQRPRAQRHSGSYDFGESRIESAHSGGSGGSGGSGSRRRRQSYYGQSASTGSGTSGGSAWEDKAAQAASYQDGVSGTAAPLTADSLRRQRHHGGSTRSTKSSGSRDESDYRQSATTRTTRSVSSPDDENVTIKVMGQARVVVGGAQIDCNEGGAIEITQKSLKGSESVRGSEWSNSEYGAEPQRRIDDRKSRIDKPASHARRRSSSYSRPSPQFSQGSFF